MKKFRIEDLDDIHEVYWTGTMPRETGDPFAVCDKNGVQWEIGRSGDFLFKRRRPVELMPPAPPPPYEGRLELAASFITGMLSNSASAWQFDSNDRRAQLIREALALADELIAAAREPS